MVLNNNLITNRKIIPQTIGNFYAELYCVYGQATPPAGSFAQVSAGVYHTCGVLAMGSGSILLVSKTGSGTVTSNPAGIDCGATCSARFSMGSSVTLTAAPDANYSFSGWSGACTNTTGTCAVTVDADKSVTATFTLNNYTLTVAKSGNGSGTVGGGGPFAYNTTVTPTATAAAGSTFAGWSPVSCGSPFNLIANTTCTAAFALKTYPVTAVATPALGGSITPLTRTVTHGATTTFTVTSNAGYTAAVTGCGGTFNPVTKIYTTGSITTACALTASFKPVLTVLTVGKTGTGAGLITSQPVGLNCGTVCAAPYPLNTAVLLTAKEAPGSAFAGWVGVCTVNPANLRQCTATLNVARTVQARFNTTTPGTTALTLYKTGVGLGTVVSIAPLPMGKINCGSVCVANFPTTATVTLTATPASGSAFAGWVGCTPKLGLPLQCTVAMNQAKTVTAAFIR